jgi:hypothetical protein
VFNAALGTPPGAPGQQVLRAVAARMGAIPRVEVAERVTSGPGETAPPTTFTLSGAALAASEPWGGGLADEATIGPDGRTLEFFLAGEPLWGTLTLDGEDRITGEVIVDIGHVVTHQLSYPPA